ncbi:MAG: MG2 domain-containing protein, partial [Verrucomicrobiota bacterium]
MTRLYSSLARKKLKKWFGTLLWKPPGWIKGCSIKPYWGWILLVAVAALGIGLSVPSVDQENDFRAKVMVPQPGFAGEEQIIPQVLRIKFNQSCAPLKHVSEGVFSGIKLIPAIKGQWRWNGDRLLEFTPEKEWPAGTEFQVKIYSKLFRDEIRWEKEALQFTTPPFGVDVKDFRFYVNPKEPEEHRATATMKFTHPVEAEELKRSLSVTSPVISQLMGQEDLADPYEITLDEFGRVAYFRTKPLKLQNEAVFLDLEIDKLAPSYGKALEASVKKDVVIPDLKGFLKVQRSRMSIVPDDLGDPRQTLVLEFSLGISPQVLERHLELYVLPERKPRLDQQGQYEMGERFHWKSPAQVSPEILKLSRLLQFEMDEVVTEFAEVHSLRLDVPPGQTVYVRVKGGLVGLGDFIMEEYYHQVFRAPGYPKELAIMNEGAVLAGSGEQAIKLKTRNITKLEYRIGKVKEEQIYHLASQTYGNFANPHFRNASFGEDNIADVYYYSVDIPEGSGKDAKFLALDIQSILPANVESKGLYFLEVHEVRSRPAISEQLASETSDIEADRARWSSQYYYDHDGLKDSRFLLVTDLGVIIKNEASGTQQAFVQSIKHGRPISGVTVKVLAKNGGVLASAKTNASGQASLPRVEHLKRERRPVAYLLSKGDDISFMPYGRADHKINFSRFDVGGIHLEDEKKLSSFVFSERGIYRPGDTVKLGGIVRSYDWDSRAVKVPLSVMITDPRGRLVNSSQILSGEDGLWQSEFETKEASPTGVYEVEVYLGDPEHSGSYLGHTSIRVEAFFPDRLKIKAQFMNESKGWLHPDQLRLGVHLNQLTGHPATDREVVTEMTLEPSQYYFESLSGYVFRDPDVRGDRDWGMVKCQPVHALTNEKGEAVLDLLEDQMAGGVYRLNYLVRGFEAGSGRNVTTGGRVLVSP